VSVKNGIGVFIFKIIFSTFIFNYVFSYPSSFFMPTRHTLNNSCTVHYRFIRSEFRGLLPSYYDSRLSFPAITRAVPKTQNDANREEMDRYLDVNECDYLFDLETVCVIGFSF
jgi:alpha-1,2-mannosyltransferase